MRGSQGLRGKEDRGQARTMKREREAKWLGVVGEGGARETKEGTPRNTRASRGPKSRFVSSCLWKRCYPTRQRTTFRPIKRRAWKTAAHCCLAVGIWIVKSKKEWRMAEFRRSSARYSELNGYLLYFKARQRWGLLSAPFTSRIFLYP